MSERLYSLILQLYPRPFRERYAEEMLRVFRGRLRDEAALRVWVDVLGDALVSIPRQHIVREPHPYYPPSAAPLLAAAAMQRQMAVVSALLGALVAVVIAVTFLAGISKTWPLAAALLGAWAYLARNCRTTCRAIDALKTVRAEASSDSVTVAYAGMAPLTLRRSEVTCLHDFEFVGLRIETGDPARDLWVPAVTKSYAAIRGHLGQWVPVKATPHFISKGFANAPLMLTILYALALLMPLTSFGLFVSLLWVVPALLAGDVPRHRKLLVAGAMAIPLVRWLW